MTSFVTHLEGAIDGAKLPADRVQTLHRDRPLWVRYDLAAVGRKLSKETLEHRPANLWRYRELLPVPFEREPVSLGEAETPLLRCSQLARRYGLKHLWIKDESHLPTGSFKSRGLSMAISMAQNFGIRRVALPSAGNAGGAAAAYAARAGMEAFVFMPQDAPLVNVSECCLSGAKTFLVNGLITECGKIVREGAERLNWFDLSTLKEPYRIEGKKTMGLELAEQFDWNLPDVILYPTGGGTGLIGMWKAFQELAALGWLTGSSNSAPPLPRMVSVQSNGCAPIATAFAAGSRFAQPFPNPATVAGGIRVPAPIGDFMILDAVRQSRGTALAVDEGRLLDWMRQAASLEGIAICPETAACIGALEELTQSGWIDPAERVVVFNTGAAQKYVEVLTCRPPRLDTRHPIDWDRLEEA